MGIVTVGLTLNVCNVSYADITVNINDIAGLTEVAKDTDGYKKEFECEKGIDIPIEGIVEISGSSSCISSEISSFTSSSGISSSTFSASLQENL